MGYINRIGRSLGLIQKLPPTVEDDGYWSTNFGDTYFMFGISTIVGARNMYARWTGITIPEGVTIKTATVRLNLVSFGEGSSAAGKLYFNDVNDAVAPTSVSEANAKVKTTAYVSVSYNTTGYKEIDVKSIINELLASFTFSDKAMMMIVIGEGSGSNSANFSDDLSADSALLTITW